MWIIQDVFDRTIGHVFTGWTFRVDCYHPDHVKVVNSAPTPLLIRLWMNKEIIMAKGKSFDWNMVNVRLDKSDKPKLAKFAEGYKGDAVSAAMDVLELGYAIKMRWSEEHQSHIVSVTGDKEHPHNPSSTMTSWARDVNEALFMCAYKVLVMFNSQDWEGEGVSDNWG